MSGLFLRALARELGSRFDLAADLGVSKPEMDTIMADPLLPTEEDKMFKMLLLSRDKQEKQETGLTLLLAVTRNRQLVDIRNWILQTAKRWMVLQGASDDHFSHAVGEILYNTTS
ncbi:hypothetical protein BaRGS_00007652 [Batillaria attramentaria]|uniref:Uncharacterized protein n=1 Tax=Batillaria attramentaria TaxID=370345 RepID=A0ABD0LNI9_9CAEN